MTILIDRGVTHYFIDGGLVTRMGLKTKDSKGFNVTLENGCALTCNRRIHQLELTLGGYKMQDDFHVIFINNVELVSGV